MARVNIDILGISELKWTGMGEFNSEDHYIYYCGQESFRRNGVAIIVNKSLKCSTLLSNMLSSLIITFLPRSKPLLISWLQSPSTVILEP